MKNIIIAACLMLASTSSYATCMLMKGPTCTSYDRTVSFRIDTFRCAAPGGPSSEGISLKGVFGQRGKSVTVDGTLKTVKTKVSKNKSYVRYAFSGEYNGHVAIYTNNGQKAAHISVNRVANNETLPIFVTKSFVRITCKNPASPF